MLIDALFIIASNYPDDLQWVNGNTHLVPPYHGVLCSNEKEKMHRNTQANMAASLGNSAECGKPTTRVIMEDPIHIIFLKWMENRLVVSQG